MVHRSDGIKGGGKAGVPPSGEMPVYPFTLDVPSMPERRHIAGIHALSRMAFVSIMISVVLCALLVLRSLSISSRPFFMYWDNIDAAFRFMPADGRGSQASPARFLTQDEFLSEHFAREYIRRTFEISPILADNEAAWCSCQDDGAPRAESVLDPAAPCFVCSFSNPAIYHSFATNQRPAFARLAAAGASRTVGITNVELQRPLYSPEKDSSIFSMILDMFFNRKKRTPVYAEYRVDFVLEDRLGTRTRHEAMRAHMTALSYVENPYFHTVDAISYMFEPAQDLAIGRYLRHKRTEEK